MKRRLLFLLLVVIVAGGAGITTKKALTQTKQVKRPAYTIVWQATQYDAAGRATLDHTETRHVSSSGNWHSVRQYADGRIEETFAEVGRGVFLMKGQKLHFLSQSSPPPVIDEEELKNSSGYLRTENVLGHPAVVIKSERGDIRSEFYRAPALGGDEIKMVFYRGATTIVVAPVSIVFGEPEPALLKLPEGLPEDYTHYERLHGKRSN